MANAVIFPKLGQTMEEGSIVKWFKKEGDPVVKGDILFEIETDKANLEVESFFEGVMLKIYIGEGITVPVNTVVGYVGAAGEKVPEQAPAPAAPAAVPAPAPAAPVAPAPAAVPAPAPAAPVAPAPAAAPAPAPATPATAPAPAVAPAPVTPALTAPAAPVGATGAPLIISPRARALARNACINPERISGSGPNGRVVERDVKAYLASLDYASLRISPAAKQLALKERIDILSVRGSGDGGRIMIEDIRRACRARPRTLSKMRQVIARRLTQSKQTIPHFYVTLKADLTELLALRRELKERGISYSVNDFILQAVVLALEEFPLVNSTTDGQQVSWHGDVNLGVAVSVDDGLLVPVVRGAQCLTMRELRDQVSALAQRAREGRLLPDEISGSSFTVSNMGMLNVDEFSAIINPGEAGILAVSSAKPAPAVVKGEILIRTLMSLTLSVDHRIVDGALGAGFINAICAKLENIELWRAIAQ